MAKVLYNGEYIELKDELEPGCKELDMLTNEQNNLEDTIELSSINLEDTMKINVDDLENTQELDLSDMNE